MGYLSSLDSQPVQFSLNFNSYNSYKSQLGGFISLTYILIGVLIFTLKSYEFYTNQHVYFTTKITKQDDLDSLDVTSGNFKLRLHQNDDQKNQSGDVYPINFQDLPRFGIRAYYHQHWSQIRNGEIRQFDSQQQMIACNKTNLYDICLPKNATCLIRGRVDFSKNRSFQGEMYHRCQLLLKLCNPETDSKCGNFSQYISFFAHLFNNYIDPNRTKHSDTIQPQPFFRVFQSDLFLNTKTQILINIFLKRVIMQTDNSRLPQLFHKPQYQTTYTWFYDEQTNQFDYPIGKQNIVLRVVLKRSAYTHTYTRNYDRFDSILGQVFGLLSLIGIVLFALYNGYNSWSFQQFMRKQLKIKYIQPNIFRYYLYLLKNICASICYCSIGLRIWKEQQNINKQKLAYKLNYMRVISLIDNNQNEMLSQEIITQRNQELSNKLLIKRN